MNADTPRLTKQGRFSFKPFLKGGGRGVLYGRKTAGIRAYDAGNAEL